MKMIRVISQTIGYTSELAPFTQCILLIGVIHFMQQAETGDEDDYDDEYDYDELDKNS